MLSNCLLNIYVYIPQTCAVLNFGQRSFLIQRVVVTQSLITVKVLISDCGFSAIEGHLYQPPNFPVKAQGTLWKRAETEHKPREWGGVL